ncbi:V-type ATP synthase subunit E [Halosegnis marinus]|uniref:A-type ATP synthase subunit E n=1 Tax=Halosegnis marinus TaxID=3034023 RepID=A0ABD5ZQ60_9EURY|nr:V-type ATP synthase subunit E [Halosegnis sp. DT85]
MSLDTVVEDIRDDARARAEEMRADGESRAEEIVSEAEADAEEIVADAEREVAQEIEQEREQRLSSAKLEAKQARLEARREALQDVHERVEAAVADIDGEEREELTRSLLDAAAAEFADADSVLVYGRAADEELLGDVLGDYDGFEYAGEYDCLGGVVVEAEGSRVRVNNTFDSVLEEVWEENLRDISERLFEER